MSRVTASLMMVLPNLLSVGQTMAHSMPQSSVAIDVSATSISVESYWPLEELELALPRPLNITGNKLSEAQQRDILDYGSRHVWIEQRDGEHWRNEVSDARVELNDGHSKVIYRAVYRRPQNSADAAQRLHYDAITHEVMSHAAIIHTQMYAGDNLLGQGNNPVAVMQNPTDILDLKLADPQPKGLSATLIGGLAAGLLAVGLLGSYLLRRDGKFSEFR
jgi:hypothetical protein